MDEEREKQEAQQPDPDELASLREELVSLRAELSASKEELSKTRQLNFTLARRLDVGSEKQTIEQQLFNLFGRKRGGGEK